MMRVLIVLTKTPLYERRVECHNLLILLTHGCVSVEFILIFRSLTSAVLLRLSDAFLSLTANRCFSASVDIVVLYLYIFIALLAVHTYQKRIQCERPRQRREQS